MDIALGTLLCTLVDRRSSVPLGDAVITCISGKQSISMHEADPHGFFRATLPEGVYDMLISARGELSLVLRGIGVLGGYEQQLTRALTPGETTMQDDDAASAVGGFITDRLGAPLANVMVRVSDAAGTQVYTTRTDRSGAFLVHSVITGAYTLALRNGDRTLLSQTADLRRAKTFIRMDAQLKDI